MMTTPMRVTEEIAPEPDRPLPDAASFRDPSGFVFRHGGAVYRQVNRFYEAAYRQLMDGGLYGALVEDGLLVDHEEVPFPEGAGEAAYCVIRPRQLPFISYPYEWSFSALKQAALLTLDVQKRALEFGMTLKDASAYNVQFEGCRPVFIDTLSFDQYEPGEAWVAYGQFCRHFLAPLALMAHRDIRLGKLLALHLDGVALDLASSLLPARTRLKPGLLAHLHLHAGMVRRYSDTTDTGRPASKKSVSKQGLTALIENLRSTVAGLNWRPAGTEWADYYENNSYDEGAFDEKQRTVLGYLEELKPGVVWDLGANTGVFSRLATRTGARTYSFDIDPACVERGFRECSAAGERLMLPLLMDLTNPTPALGWAHRERMSLAERGPCDVALALALIHHLSISNNVPLGRVAQYLSGLCRHLIIEWVPKQDVQVQRLLRSRRDVFEDYTQDVFEAEFQRCFRILDRRPIGDMGRVAYLLESARSLDEAV